MEKEKLYDKWTATGLETIKACVEDKIANYCELNKKQCQEVLNLIEKQQKEIEKLKSKKYILNAETNEIKEIPISDDYISKDKIRHIRDKAECMDYYSLNDVIDDLSKLLGDENNE